MEEARECALERQKSEDVNQELKASEKERSDDELKKIENDLLTDEDLVSPDEQDQTTVVSNTEESSYETVERMETWVKKTIWR